MKSPRRFVLLLFPFLVSAAPAQQGSTTLSTTAEGYDVHSETRPAFEIKVRTLTDDERARLKVEWIGTESGHLEYMDQTVPQSKLWVPAKDGNRSYQIGVKGRLLLVSADGKTREPVTWLQPLRVIMACRPDAAPDWSQHHRSEDTVSGDTIVEKDGTFVAALDASDLRRVPGKEADFRAGLCLGTHKKKTITWTGAAPVLAQSLTKFSVKGPRPLSRIQKIINTSPLPAAGGFDPVALIRAVNELHALGKDKALAELRSFAKEARGFPTFEVRVPEDISTADKQCLFAIIMLLFEADSPKYPVPNPALGGPLPSPGAKDWPLWPLYPFVVEDDIPFCLAEGFVLAGMATPPETHIKWAEQHGRLRTKPLRPKTDPVTAATKILATPQGQRLFGKDCKAEHYHGILMHQALAALPGLLPPTKERGRFITSKNYDGDADWRDCQQKAAALDLRWDADAMKWVKGR